MHQTLCAIKIVFISIIVNNNDKYFFFLDLSVGYQHFKYTFNRLSNLSLVLFLLLIFSHWEVCFILPEMELANSASKQFWMYLDQ